MPEATQQPPRRSCIPHPPLPFLLPEAMQLLRPVLGILVGGLTGVGMRFGKNAEHTAPCDPLLFLQAQGKVLELKNKESHHRDEGLDGIRVP